MPSPWFLPAAACWDLFYFLKSNMLHLLLIKAIWYSIGNLRELWLSMELYSHISISSHEPPIKITDTFLLLISIWSMYSVN